MEEPMCRFAVISAQQPFQSDGWLHDFAAMAEASRSPDGDRQGDGWGASWLDANGQWQRHRSLAPVWLDRAWFAHVPPTRCLVLHARSASFPEERTDIERCQPFMLGRHAFVFNGLLRGVSLPVSRPGMIGAQRLATLTGALLARNTPTAALTRLWRLLHERTAAIPAINLALTDGHRIAVLSHCEVTPDYYRLWTHRNDDTVALASEPLASGNWRPLEADPIAELEPARITRNHPTIVHPTASISADPSETLT
jgi:predicted glutamine amidotransferase